MIDKDLLNELANEIETEKQAGLSESEKVLAEVARELLLLERDMLIPGKTQSDSVRVDRLAEILRNKDF
jgi:hypothetical protein